MPKTLTAISTSINPSLITFTPRQVLLANPKMAAPKSSSLSEEDRTLLLLSIAQYLQKTGFSKTLKKFLSEAQLEKDGWKGSLLDLEEMCLKFLDRGNNAPPCSSGLNQDGKRKKKRKEDGENVVADQSGAADESVNVNDSIKEKKSAKKSSETLTKEIQEVRPEEDNKMKKGKKKKDRKSVPEPVAEEENQETETMPEQTTRGKSEDLTTSKEKNDASAEVEKKSKDKKKKKSKSTSDDVANDAEEKQDVQKSKPTKMDTKKAGSDGETLTSEVNKDSKPHKRKRLESEENDSQQIDTAPAEQSKRRKKEKKEEIASEQNSEVAHGNGEVDLLESQKTPSKDRDTENVNLGKTAEKTATGKAMKRQLNGSAEPKSTLKAFSRIKVDEVEFVDERLKDNSYWAKDGAEIGYGAKAQEVLGQVRGRDFRHEKTKKKRGSYRGRIDQDTHSVKFNYSDEE